MHKIMILLILPVEAAEQVDDEEDACDEEDVHVELLRVAGALVVEAVDVAVDELVVANHRDAPDHQPRQQGAAHRELDWTIEQFFFLFFKVSR